MRFVLPRQEPWVTLFTLCLGAVGGGLAYAAAVPAAVLIGPALMVSVAGLAGAPLCIPDRLRDVCFVVLGIGLGAGFDPDAGNAILKWPMAFVLLAALMVVTIVICRIMLERLFGFDRRSAVLAAAPGHLSFVMGIAATGGVDVGRIAVVQTIRLLALTLMVPFLAAALGYRIPPSALLPGAAMQAGHILILIVLGTGLGLVFRRLGAPAPLLLGAMAVSAIGHVTGLVPGGLPALLMTPAFLVLGTLIGTRFSGMSGSVFRASLAAGLGITVLAALLSCLAALPVAWALSMPAPHALAAFAPGGLETMIALGAAMGASPGFVAACHVMRLVILSFLIPLELARTEARRPS